MIEKETIIVSGDKVEMDPANLRFSENTLSEYIKTEGSWYDNFGAYLARAERDLQIKEAEHDNLYHLKFYLAKEEGGSDKLAEARAKIDRDVREAKSESIQAKYLVSRLKSHLRAWDKNHDNAQSLGHQLRKEMSMLFSDIKTTENNQHHRDPGLYGRFDEVDNIVSSVDTEDAE